MRWWRRRGRPERSWKSGLKYWSGETMRSAKDWRGLKVRYRELRGLEDCLCLDDNHEEREPNATCLGLRSKGIKLVNGGIRRYVRIRVTGIKPRRHGRSNIKSPNTLLTYSDARHTQLHPLHFRHVSPTSSQGLPILALDIPDFERWVNELWHDFLIEPTPYLGE
jgi:hypothetical protein